jgi:hypothetical protein
MSENKEVTLPKWRFRYTLTDGYQAAMPDKESALKAMLYEMTAQKQSMGVLSEAMIATFGGDHIRYKPIATFTMNWDD